MAAGAGKDGEEIEATSTRGPPRRGRGALCAKMPPMNLAVPPAVAVAPPTRALAGVDFTSAPRRGKPVVWAWGAWQRPGLLKLERFEEDASAAAFAASLRRPGPWLAAFDMPFGLPRELLAALGWPADWAGSMAHYASLSRGEIVAAFSAFCDARPAGAKFAHRACDGPAGSSPSMKWVNPPASRRCARPASTCRALLRAIRRASRWKAIRA